MRDHVTRLDVNCHVTPNRHHLIIIERNILLSASQRGRRQLIVPVAPHTGSRPANLSESISSVALYPRFLEDLPQFKTSALPSPRVQPNLP